MARGSCLSGTSKHFRFAGSACFCLIDFNQSVSRLKPSTSVGIQQVIGLVKQNKERMGICKS